MCHSTTTKKSRNSRPTVFWRGSFCDEAAGEMLENLHARHRGRCDPWSLENRLVSQANASCREVTCSASMTDGSAETLLFLPGASGNTAFWRPVADGLRHPAQRTFFARP